MSVSKDRIGAFLFLVFSCAYGVYAWQIPLLPTEQGIAVSASTLPKIYAVVGVVVSLLALAGSFLQQVSGPQGDSGALALGRTALLLVLMVLYALMLDPLGFLLATEVFLLAGYLLMGEYRPKVLFWASVPVVVVFWLIMTRVLGIYLAPGMLWS